VSGPATSASGYGTYTIDATGHWSFALDNSNATVNALNNGGTLSDSFTVTTSDGTSQVVNITINGHTDATDVLAPTDIVFNLAASTGSLSGNMGSGTTLGSFTAIDADSISWTFTIGSVTGQTLPPVAFAPTNSGSSVNLVTNASVGAGNYMFTVTATDPAGHSYAETYTLSVGNSADNTSSFFTVSTGTDISFGLNGNDSINGGAGDDALVGGQNGDILTGGGGADQLIGGQGADTFTYAATSDSIAGHNDTILDFDETVSGERMDLSAIDANLALANDQAFTFVVGQTTSVANNSVTWYQDAVHNTTVVQADNNGDGFADLVITLSGIHSLTNNDFIL
jgi:VCBS repeat-containing protein